MNNEFYEDEVSEGFYVPSMIKKAWGAQLDVLNETDRICRRHNIPYFADWGSLLAAIRHNGYIPWDDDLDISMRRRDYERFLRHAEDELPEGFKVMHFKNHPQHHFFVARIVGKPRICFEEEHLTRFHGFPYIAGIDLFVLDNVYRDRKKEKLRSKRAEYVLAVADNIADGKTNAKETEELLKQCEQYTGKKINRKLSGEELRIFMYGLVEEIFASVPDEESDELVQMMPFGMYERKLYIPKEYYSDTVRLPYMNTTIQVPICYDAVMRRKFGNYMKIQRKWDGHEYPFFYGQHEQLIKTLDFEYPAYKASAGDITAKPVRSDGVRDVAEEYAKRIRSYAEDAQLLQQTSIEFGTLIESAYGEGYRTVTILEQLCEAAYQYSIKEGTKEEIEAVIDALEESISEDILSRHDIVFMPFAAKHWQYMEKLYRYYESDDRYNVSVMPVPYYYKGWDGAFTEEVFDRDAYPSDLPFIDCTKVNLEAMHPEKIIIQNPFDEWNPVMSVPPEMFSPALRKYTDELVYIPFFVTDDLTKENGPEYVNMDHYVCVPGVINSDRIILPTETLKNTYMDKITGFVNTTDREVLKALDEKIEVAPQFVFNPKKEDCEYVCDKGGRKTLVYFTTVSFLAERGSKGIEKINSVIDILMQNKDKMDVIWVFQCIKDNIEKIDNGVADDFRKAVKRFENAKIGRRMDDIPKAEHKRIAKMCDAYYGDPSALALEFYYEHKPVMIIG